MSRRVDRSLIHDYWREPWDGRNGPDGYVQPGASPRSAYLVQLFQKWIPQDASIFELGCNAGRNLAHLHAAGFTSLEACDISQPAIDVLRATFPELAEVPVTCAPAEELLTTIAEGAHDVVFTMAVLEHIHPESEHIFGEMARIAGKHVITIEDEALSTWRHFPRQYREIFESRHGLTQLHAESCARVRGLGRRFVARVFGR